MSDWCAGGPLVLPRHAECRMAGCRCDCHETPAVERDSRQHRDTMGAKKAAPGGASTPSSRGLADDWSVD